MTIPTTAQTIEVSAIEATSAPATTGLLGSGDAAIVHLEDDLDDAIEMLLQGGFASSLICDGTCHGTASCCIAPVGPAATLMAA
jgi:hypothetical protein